MRLANINENVTLFLQLDTNDNNQYPQAIIINAAGSIVGVVTLNLSSVVDGKYLNTFTFTEYGDYSIKYVIYSDSGHTVINKKYRFSDETIRVSNLEQNVQDILNGNLGEPIAIFD